MGNFNDNNYNIKYVLALLNSLCINHWFRFYYTDVNIKPEQLRKIPIKKADKNKQDVVVCMVDKILNLTKSCDYKQDTQKQQAVKEYENQIDIMVYKLYNLTYQEVLTIDKDFPMSEDNYNNYTIWGNNEKAKTSPFGKYY